MDDKLLPVLVGAVLTLLATVVVQALVVPWAQARTRRFERWETSVIELLSMLEEELPRAVADYRAAAEDELTYQSAQHDPDVVQETLQALLAQARDERKTASEVLGQRRRRLRVLVSRVVSLRRSAPLWSQVRTTRMRLDFSLRNPMFMMLGDELKSWDDPTWKEAWDEYSQTETEFAELVNELSARMRLPARRILYQVRLASTTWLMKQRRRRQLPASTEAPEPAPATAP